MFSDLLEHVGTKHAGDEGVFNDQRILIKSCRLPLVSGRSRCSRHLRGWFGKGRSKMATVLDSQLMGMGTATQCISGHLIAPRRR